MLYRYCCESIFRILRGDETDGGVSKFHMSIDDKIRYGLMGTLPPEGVGIEPRLEEMLKLLRADFNNKVRFCVIIPCIDQGFLIGTLLLRFATKKMLYSFFFLSEGCFLISELLLPNHFSP